MASTRRVKLFLRPLSQQEPKLHRFSLSSSVWFSLKNKTTGSFHSVWTLEIRWQPCFFKQLVPQGIMQLGVSEQNTSFSQMWTLTKIGEPPCIPLPFKGRCKVTWYFASASKLIPRLLLSNWAGVLFVLSESFVSLSPRVLTFLCPTVRKGRLSLIYKGKMHLLLLSCQVHLWTLNFKFTALQQTCMTEYYSMENRNVASKKKFSSLTLFLTFNFMCVWIPFLYGRTLPPVIWSDTAPDIRFTTSVRTRHMI